MGMTETLSTERQCLMALLLESYLYTESQLMDLLEKAKSTPEYQQAASQHFADTWLLLNNLGMGALYETHHRDEPI
jgi:hypothetical protein